MRFATLASLLFALTACGLDTVSAKDANGYDEPVTYGDLELSAAVLDFGFVEPGDSATESLVVSNTGADPITVTGLALDYGTAFTMVQSTALPLALSGGEELIIDIQFAPEATQEFADVLTLTTDNPDAGSVAIELAGTAIGDTTGDDDTGDPGSSTSLDVSATSFDFGYIDIGLMESRDLTITNPSSEDVLIFEFDASESVFDWGGEFTLPYVLTAGESKDVTLTYEPRDEQVDTGTITLKSDADSGDIVMDVTGEGFHGCTVCAPLISVETYDSSGSNTLSGFVVLTALGGTDTKTIDIWNGGDEDLEISDISIQNDSLFPQGGFSLSSWSGSETLAPGAKTSVDVTYTASESGIELSIGDDNTVTISSNDPWDPEWVIALSGLAL